MTVMTEEAASKRRDNIESRLEEIEDEIQDLKDEKYRLEDEMEALDKKFPPPPEPRRVGAFEFDGATWHTDGWRMVRGPWPGPHEVTMNLPPEKAVALAAEEAAAETPIVTVTHEGDDYEQTPLALLSNGIAVNRDWLADALANEGAVIHANRAANTPVQVRQGGVLVALIMPVYRAATEWRAVAG